MTLLLSFIRTGIPILLLSRHKVKILKAAPQKRRSFFFVLAPANRDGIGGSCAKRKVFLGMISHKLSV